MSSGLLAMLPICSKRLPWSQIKNVQGDLNEYFFHHVVDCAKAAFFRMGTLCPSPMINVMGHAVSATERFSSRRTQIYQHAIDASLIGTHKEVLAQIMPDFLEKVGAFCVVTASESWALMGPKVRRVYETHGSIQAHPDSFECVSFVFEDTEGTRTECYPILRDGTKVSLGENCVPSDPGVSAEGTFTHWLREIPKGMN